MMRNVLIVFCKYPIVGKVKTRLAADIGADQACKLYRIMCEEIFRLCNKVQIERQCTICIYIDDIAYMNDISVWTQHKFTYSVQQGITLGDRLYNACADEFLNKKSDKVVIIGTDSPMLSSKIIYEAFDALDTFDYVVGPTLDGGYYTIGMTNIDSNIFQGISWSTEIVNSQTQEIINKYGKSVKLLETLPDIDTYEDLNILHDKYPQIYDKLFP